MNNARKWTGFQPVQRKDPPGKYPAGSTPQTDGWQLVNKFPSIKLLNDEVANLVNRGNQVVFITTPMQGEKPYRVINYLLWKNPRTGAFIAETRIIEGSGQNPQVGRQAVPGIVVQSPKLG